MKISSTLNYPTRVNIHGARLVAARDLAQDTTVSLDISDKNKRKRLALDKLTTSNICSAPDYIHGKYLHLFIDFYF